MLDHGRIPERPANEGAEGAPRRVGAGGARGRGNSARRGAASPKITLSKTMCAFRLYCGKRREVRIRMGSLPSSEPKADAAAVPGRGLDLRILFWSVTSALAGFLFGFDTVVISGAEQTIQTLWDLSPAMHGFAMASALYGTVLGSLLGGWPTDRFGRKPTLLCDRRALPRFGASGRRLRHGRLLVHRGAVHRRHRHRRLHRGRAALHLGDRAARPTAGGWPACSSSTSSSASSSRSSRTTCSPASARTPGGGCSASRPFPRCCTRSLCFGHPRKPPLAAQPEAATATAGIAVLRLHPTRRVRRRESKREADEIVAAADEQASAAAVSGPRGCGRRSCWPSSIAFFNQLSGINAILYFAPRIFELTGLGREGRAAAIRRHRRHQPRLHLRRPLADRPARPPHAALHRLVRLHPSLGLCAWAFFTETLRHRAGLHLRLHRRARGRAGGRHLGVHLGNLPQPPPGRGPGAGQLHALDFRRAARRRSSRDGHAFAPGYVFLFFCGMMVLQLVWVKTMVPETKGVPLEEMEQRLTGARPGRRGRGRRGCVMRFKLVGIGEVLWDLLPGGRQLGGAPANFAYHASALGAEARVVSRVRPGRRGARPRRSARTARPPHGLRGGGPRRADGHRRGRSHGRRPAALHHPRERRLGPHRGRGRGAPGGGRSGRGLLRHAGAAE